MSTSNPGAPAPTASVESAPMNPRTPIGEAHILVYDWGAGQTEVQVRFPAEAHGGGTTAATKRQDFGALTVSELQSALKQLS